MSKVTKIKKYKAIDFFCGGVGMKCGLRQVVTSKRLLMASTTNNGIRAELCYAEEC